MDSRVMFTLDAEEGALNKWKIKDFFRVGWRSSDNGIMV